MRAHYENELAFPVTDGAAYMPGMTLRDYFAASAIQGLCQRSSLPTQTGIHQWADLAYTMADAMLKAREQ